MFKKLKAKFYPLICFVIGGGMIAAGIVTLASGKIVIQVACYIGGAVVLLHGLSITINGIFKRKTLTKEGKGIVIASSAFNTAAGVLVLLLPTMKLIPVYFIFVAYILINAAIKLVDYAIDKRDDVPGRVWNLLMFLFFFVFGVLMIFVPGMGEQGFLVVAGIYCIIYGAFMLLNFVYQCLPDYITRRIRYKISLPMPVLFSTMLPYHDLTERHRKNVLDPENEREEIKPFYPEGKETDRAPDLEVMVHVSSRGLEVTGHTDICFEGEIISYGSYDLTSAALFGGIGDGILVVGRKEPYIRFYVTNSPREIYSYGFRLTEEQKQAVRDEIKEIRSMAYPWEPPLQQVLKNDPDAKGEAVSDWGSRMWNCTGSDFYKFRSGKMKTYFVVTSNCVMMTDMIVRKACSSITTPRQLLTPGAYYDYLERLLAMNNSPVFCRVIYNKRSTADWTYTPRAPYSEGFEILTETQANRKAAEKEGKKADRRRIRKEKKVLRKKTEDDS